MGRPPKNKPSKVSEPEKRIDDQIFDLIKQRKLQQEALLKIKYSVERPDSTDKSKK